MGLRYRVECARPGFEHKPGLHGDYDDEQQARQEATTLKSNRPDCRVTITPGEDIPPDQQPEERRHPNGHHFLALRDAVVEVIE